jgi:hypothetical protein
MVALDPIGNVSLLLQITILFLLVLGLPLVKGDNTKKNMTRHGYLAVAALVLHSVLIFAIMVPSFDNGLGELGRIIQSEFSRHFALTQSWDWPEKLWQSQ